VLKPASYTGEERIVKIKTGRVSLEANLMVPDRAYGMVIFAHESGSNRFNPTNRFIAKQLHKVGIGALLFDMLDPWEAEVDKISRNMRFDIDLMVDRIESVTDWLEHQPRLPGLPIGYFGSGRGAAAVLMAAAYHPEVIRAVVSHGGRLDLATTALGEVTAPTLLVVGKVQSLLNINKNAYQGLSPELEKKLEVFKEVSYFWDEPETLKKLSVLTGGWFERYLGDGMGLYEEASGLVTI
jgi:putative phosphoribosyl transferase